MCTVDVAGWIVDTQRVPVAMAWLDFGGEPVQVPLDRPRPDVARSLTIADVSGRGIGFESRVQIPADAAPGLVDVRVIGRTAQGTGVYAETIQRVRIAHPRRAPRAFETPSAPISFDLRINDTQSGTYTLGRGAFTVRQESALRVSGRIDGATNLHIAASPAAGESVAWDCVCDVSGRFDATLWTGDLERGLYDLTFGVVNGERVESVARCCFDIAGPHYIPPLHLTALRSAPLGAVTRYSDGGPRGSGQNEIAFVSGRPIAIAGWCLDSAGREPPLAVYAEIDDRRPIPLSHHLPDPRANAVYPGVRCGFGGIVDTTRLEAGRHRIRILAAAVSGAGWYVLDDREVELVHHRQLFSSPSGNLQRR